MDKYIEFLEQEFKKYQGRKDFGKEYKNVSDDLNILVKMIKNKDYSMSNFLEVFGKYIEQVNSESSKKILYYLSNVFEFNSTSDQKIPLDEKQEKVLFELKDLICELQQKVQEASTRNLDYLERLINDLKSNKPFVNTDDLRRSFEDLQQDLKTQVKILTDIIERNAKIKVVVVEEIKEDLSLQVTSNDNPLVKLPTKEEETHELASGDLRTAEAIITEYNDKVVKEETAEKTLDTSIEVDAQGKIVLPLLNNDESDVALVLSRFDINYNELSNLNKERLIKLVSIDNMNNVLGKLQEYSVLNSLKYKDLETSLVKILILSRPEIIDDVYYIYNKYNTRGGSFDTFVSKHLSILMSNKFKIPRISTQEQDDFKLIFPTYENVKENIVFLESKKYNVSEIFGKTDVIKKNPVIVKKTYSCVSDEYKIRISSKSLNFLRTTSSVTTLDALIEVCNYGYPTAARVTSRLTTLSQSDLKAIKYAYSKKGDNQDVITRFIDDTKVKYYIDFDKINKIKKEVPSLDDEFKTDIEITRKVNGTTEEITEIYNKKYSKEISKLPTVNTDIFDNPFVSYIENNFCKKDDNDPEISEVIYELKDEGDNHVTRISRPKFLRVCTVIYNDQGTLDAESVFYALTYGSLIDSKDFERLKKVLQSLRSLSNESSKKRSKNNE